MNMHAHTNQLIHESSPYLLQHAHNPVNWHPWNKDTLDKARESGKMILVSIGYSACHWCHVMEHESFEDEEVARVMNENFICIKVDREERPDVDQLYMDAVQTISGRGGWPLNCFALPDGKPFWGATYFQRDQWIDILNNVVKLFSTQRKKLEQQAKDIYEGISNNAFVDLKPVSAKSFSVEDADEMAYSLGDRMDRESGGFKGAPKFPMPNNILFMLRYHFFSGNPEALELVNLTLKKMAHGGIYDQLGGGFSRYSVDDHWHVPHFEKMLYDNAQLVSLYAEAYQLTKDADQEKVIRETMEFILRELSSPEGGFFSALDADSEGEEGKFYAWTEEEFQTAAGKDADLLAAHFGIGGRAYWEEGKHVLINAISPTDLAVQRQLPLEEVQETIRQGRQNLFAARSSRVRPGLDDKILTSWNALMLKGCVDAYRALGDQSFLQLALRNAAFIQDHLYSPEGKLQRTWKNGKAAIPAFLDDYAFLIEALLALYEVTFDEKWANQARDLADTAIKHFLDEKSGMFYYTSDFHDDAVARKMEVADNVTPASSSVMARVLYLLGLIFENPAYTQRAEGMLQKVQDKLLRFPSAFSNWGMLSLNQVYTFHTAVVTGAEAENLRDSLMQRYLPHVFYAGGAKQPALPIAINRWNPEKTQVFVCTGDSCQLPSGNLEQVLKNLEIRK